MHIYPRTYIRNIRIRRKDMTIVDNPFPQPYIQSVGPNSCRNKVNMSKLSKKAQKDLMKRNVRIQKVSTEKKVSVQYTDFCFRPIDDGPKIIEQVIISPPNPDLPVESLVESSNDDISMVEQSSDSIGNVEVIYGNVEVVQPSESEFIVAIQNTDNENLSVIHSYLEISDELEPDDNLLSSLDQISLEDYGPLVPSVETNDFALDAAHDSMVLDVLQCDPMLSSTAVDDNVDLSTYADEDVSNDLIESIRDLQ